MSRPTCESCLSAVRRARAEDRPLAPGYWCHRGPPRLREGWGDRSFPPVYREDWCGEWRPRPVETGFAPEGGEDDGRVPRDVRTGGL